MIDILNLDECFRSNCPGSFFFAKTPVNLRKWSSCMCPAAGNFEISIFTVFESMIDLISITYQLAVKIGKKFLWCISFPALLIIIED